MDQDYPSEAGSLPVGQEFASVCHWSINSVHIFTSRFFTTNSTK